MITIIELKINNNMKYTKLMQRFNKNDEVSLSVLWRGLKGYSLDMFKYDCIAAISVALLSVPLSMAYALAAGLPPVVGIFATIFGTIFAAAFGSSRHLIIGPTNTIAILIQAGISQILYTYYREATVAEQSVLALNIMIQLTLVVGILQFLAGLFKLGRLTQFVSKSVVVGYVLGASLAILVAQLYSFFGISLSEKPQSIYLKLKYLVLNWRQIHLPTVFIGVGSLLFLILTSKFSKKFPSTVLLLGLSSIAVVAFNLSPDVIDWAEIQEASLAKVVIVKDFGEITSISPHLSSPFFDTQIISTLLPIAFAIALLGVLEATAISRTIAAQTGQVLSMNQEMFALGMTNVFVSFLGAMPCSGSFARSSLNFIAGAKTRVAAVLSGLFVALLFIVFKPVVLHIPLASLAAILIISSIRMINFTELKLCLKATASDAFVLIFTTLSCVIFNIEVGFYVGVVLSIVCYLKQAAKPQFVECFIGQEGEIRTISHLEEIKEPRVRILQVEGELFFAAADLLQASVKTVANDPRVRVIMLDMSGAYHIDATACVVLESLYRYLKQSGRHLILAGLSRSLWQVFCDSGLAKEIGTENLFLGNTKSFNEAISRALSVAEYINGSLDQFTDSEDSKTLLPSTGSHLSVWPPKGTVS
jgi:SulP family sulfate permease